MTVLATRRRIPYLVGPAAQPLPAVRPSAAVSLQAVLLALSLALALLGSTQWVHPAWSFVALMNYLWLCMLLFRLEPRGAMLALPMLINNASSMIALIMIEHGAEMFELGMVGRPGPWSNALNICNIMLCIGIIAGFRPLARMLDRRQAHGLTPVLDRFANSFAWIIVAAGAFLALALILRGLQSGFPLLAGTDRFTFRRFSADKVTLYALNLKFVIGYALGFVAFALPASRIVKTSAITLFFFSMVLYFLFGDKFFTQLSAFSAFLAPYLYLHHDRVARRIWGYAVIAALSLAAVMGVTTFIYSKGFTETTAATTKRLSDRMTGQGELWFLQSSIGAPKIDWNKDLLNRFSQSLTVKSVDLFAAQKALGAHYFSNRYAPDYLRASIQRNAGSVTYTAVTEAMGLVLFGWVGLAFMMFLVGALLGLSCAYMAYAIHNRSILSAIFASYINTMLRASIIQAAPWTIASIYSLRWLSLILTIELALLVIGRGSSGSRLSHGRTNRRLAPRFEHTA